MASVPARAALEFASPDEFWQLRVEPRIEAVGWFGDSPPPALLEYPDANDSLFAPRLEVLLDASIGPHVFFHATTRWDRGFDPGSREDGEIRLDDIFLRLRVFDDERLNFQLGKFPTIFGAWVGQEDFFDDPFLLAPLPYSQIIGIHSRNPAVLAPAILEARARGDLSPVSLLPKQNWASVIWGPSAATGAAAFGSLGRFDYAFEIKNAGLSSHEDAWHPDSSDFDHPTFSVRAGFRPDAAWALGVSASRGPYLSIDTEPLMPGGIDPADLTQSTVGIDARWAHHDVIIAGEVIASEFETAAAGDLRTLGWFLQARWKAAPGFWLAGRVGQMVFNEADSSRGQDVEWNDTVWRAELGAGWRLTPNLLLKANYSFTHGGDDAAGEHLLGLGFGWRL